MNEPATTPRTASDREAPDVVAPLLSAAVFGYYGFLSGITSDITNDAGEVVPLWVGSLWILRLCTLAFIGCAVVGFLKLRQAGLIFGIAGMFAALGLFVVLAWSQLDTEYDFACHPLILLVFGCWNAYVSFIAIRASLR